MQISKQIGKIIVQSIEQRTLPHFEFLIETIGGLVYDVMFEGPFDFLLEVMFLVLPTTILTISFLLLLEAHNASMSLALGLVHEDVALQDFF